ncbi:MAG TPA: A/G-specific adenine glycosylase [Lacipirellulaceae bacterium]|jgi:A/G-specific adenine glycosylase
MSTATDRTSKTSLRQAGFSASQKGRLQTRLLVWYANHARDLPWRRSRDPYRVWISEIMLQQTQVATVRDYFERFVAAFPDVRKLAAADEQQVLRLWEGLGYYRRARQLHAAAKVVAAEHDGRFPQCVDKLQALPGIGRYTAGAIASIAFDVRAPILEANTIRLLSRLVGYRDDPMKTAGQRLLWQTATDLLPESAVAEFNQALMELGSLVCTPAEPKCDECPLAKLCAAHAAGLQHLIPRPKIKQRFTDLHEVAVVIQKAGRVLMRQCGEGERWAGLWDFPRFAIEAEGPLFARKEIVAKVHEQTGVRCTLGPLLKTLKHGVTRYRITLDCYRATVASGQAANKTDPKVRWVATGKLADLPLSTTGRKLAAIVEHGIS